MADAQYKTFSDFYAFYLTEHSNQTARRLHFTGSSLALACLLFAVIKGLWWYLPLGIVLGYGFAWVGHFVYEKNRPATFKHPFYSFMGDWRMWWEMLMGKLAF
ncbi:MAG: Mpo1-like protein [Solimonas sp.]|jgi:hypothetical protein